MASLLASFGAPLDLIQLLNRFYRSIVSVLKFTVFLLFQLNQSINDHLSRIVIVLPVPSNDF